MKLVGAAGQQAPHFLYDASGALASGTAPQLILPRRMACSYLHVQNISAAVMFLEIGSARASATITNGAVSAITVTNPGFGFSSTPFVQLRGGGAGMYPGFLGAGEPGAPTPQQPATAHCVMSGTAPNMSVASIAIDFPGRGYLVAPYVQITNNPIDALGCADPSQGGGSGIQLAAGASYTTNGTVTTTDPLALFSATAGSKYTVKWAD